MKLPSLKYRAFISRMIAIGVSIEHGAGSTHKLRYRGRMYTLHAHPSDTIGHGLTQKVLRELHIEHERFISG